MTDHTPAERHRAAVSSAMLTHSAQEGRLRSIAVIGSSGFIGSATVRALTTLRCRVVAIVRQRPQVPYPGVRYVVADIAQLRSLVRALEGVDVIVHAASYTGSDERLCETVNRLGTENVIAAAGAHRIEHVINTSTIGVYGLGPFSNIVEDTREPNPVTALSAARAAADDFVRSRGGTTVRPGFVYGPGDRWFLPGLQSILGKAQTWIDHGSARLSVIAVDELGALIAELALRCSADDQGALFHAAHPDPATVRDTAIRLSGRDFTAPSASCTYTEALSHTSDLGLTARQIDLVGRDHSLDSSKIWDRTQRTSGGLDVQPYVLRQNMGSMESATYSE